MYSPAAIDGAAPNTVTRSRCPRALMRRTQKPLSALWKVTRSTRPANGSRSPGEPDPAVSIRPAMHRERTWHRSHFAGIPWGGNPDVFPWAFHLQQSLLFNLKVTVKFHLRSDDQPRLLRVPLWLVYPIALAGCGKTKSFSHGII